MSFDRNFDKCSLAGRNERRGQEMKTSILARLVAAGAMLASAAGAAPALLLVRRGLGVAAQGGVVFLMSVFPICINTWHGVTAVPKTLIEVGKSFVAPNTVILRRIILPATLPYIMAGIRLAVGRAVVAMVIAEFFTSISGLGA